MLNVNAVGPPRRVALIELGVPSPVAIPLPPGHQLSGDAVQGASQSGARVGVQNLCDERLALNQLCSNAAFFVQTAPWAIDV